MPAFYNQHNCFYICSVPTNTTRFLSKPSVENKDNMGGDRNLSRLSQPKADYPILARKPVGKLIDNIYLGRIEREYKDGQYGKVTLSASVSPLDYPIRIPVRVPC